MPSLLTRRRFLAGIGCGGLSLGAGCLNDPGSNGGIVTVYPSDAPPAATVTPASSVSNDPIRHGLQQAADSGAVTDVEVDEAEFETVVGALSSFPHYSRSDSYNDSDVDYAYPSGLYLRYAGGIYVVKLSSYCSDSPFVEARGKQGKYVEGVVSDEKGSTRATPSGPSERHTLWVSRTDRVSDPWCECISRSWVDSSGSRIGERPRRGPRRDMSEARFPPTAGSHRRGYSLGACENALSHPSTFVSE